MKKLFSILTATLLTVSQLGGVANVVRADTPTCNGDWVVACIDSTWYETLAAAVDAAPTDNTETTITLVWDGDRMVWAWVKVIAWKNVVIDLNWKVYEVTNPTVWSAWTETNAFQLLNWSKVTFKNWWLESTVAKIFLQNYSNLTLDNVIINKEKNPQMQYAVSNNFNSLTVRGASEIYWSEWQVAFDVYYWPSNWYSDWVIVSFWEDFVWKVVWKIEYDSDWTDAWKENIAKKARLVINWWDFSQATFSIIESTIKDGDSANITLPNWNFLTSDWKFASCNVKIEDVCYETLAAAVDAAPTDNTETTITLVWDGDRMVWAWVKVIAWKNVVIDLNWKVYEVTNPTVWSAWTETNAFQLLNWSKVTFKNWWLESTVAKIFLQNYSNLTLDNVIINKEKNPQMQYAVSNNFNSLTVRGASEIYWSEWQVAFDVYYWPSNWYSDWVIVSFWEDFVWKVVWKIEYDSDWTDAWKENIAKKARLVINWWDFSQATFSIIESTIKDGDSANITLPDEHVIYCSDENVCKIVKASYSVTFDDSTVSENDKVAEVAYNGKVSAPSVSKSCYSLDGWYNGETKYDFDAPVAEDLILKAKWTYTCSRGGSSVKKEEPKTEDKVAEEYAEETFGYDEATETPEATILDSVDYTAPDEQSLADFTETILAALADDADVLARIEAGLASLADSEMDQELKDAYQYALLRGITTMDSIEKADLDRGMTRAEMAKMLAVFAQKVLGKEVLKSDTPSYADLGEMEGDLPGYIQLAYQLQIMGIDAKGNPLENFNLHALVTRAEFATVLSRVLFGDAFNQEGTYYEKHLEALKAAGILTNTDPNMEEMRGWVMLMLMRTENVK